MLYFAALVVACSLSDVSSLAVIPVTNGGPAGSFVRFLGVDAPLTVRMRKRWVDARHLRTEFMEHDSVFLF